MGGFVGAADGAGNSGSDAFGDGGDGGGLVFLSPPGDSGKKWHSKVGGYGE